MFWVRFKAHTVDTDYGYAVGYGVTALYGYPCVALTLLFFRVVKGVVAYGCGINQQVCPLECHDARALGVPLVPAYHYTKSTERGLYRLKSDVTGGEIEILIVTRVIGDMHFTVFASYVPVALKDYSGVVVQSGLATFKERCDQHHAIFACELCVVVRGLSRYRCGYVECVDILGLAEIQTVVQFLQDDELGALPCELADFPGQSVAVVADACRVVLLYDAKVRNIYLMTLTGYCIVEQCKLPCCLMRAQQSIPLTSYFGKMSCSAFSAVSSLSDCL